MANRDLSFSDVSPDGAERLTPQQIDCYNRNGYVAPLDVYDAETANRNRDYFDSLLEQAARIGEDSYSINGYHTVCKGLYDIVTDPRILDYVEDIAGPNIIAWGTHYFSKMPGDGKHVPWHQDASYWPLTPARTVTAWLAIDDADVENAAMRFIPGTHRLGHLEWHQTEKDAVLNQEISDAGQYGEPYDDSLKAGQISLHADMLAHGSEPNESDRRRCGLTVRYCPPEVLPLTNWGLNAILCRGEDGTGYWTHNPRPDSDEINPGHLQKIFGDDLGFEAQK